MVAYSSKSYLVQFHKHWLCQVMQHPKSKHSFTCSLMMNKGVAGSEHGTIGRFERKILIAIKSEITLSDP